MKSLSTISNLINLSLRHLTLPEIIIYLRLLMHAKIHLDAMNLEVVIKEENQASLQVMSQKLIDF